MAALNPPPLSASEQEDIREALAERAAIAEYDGRMTRTEANSQAKAAARVFRFRVTDKPGAWCTLIAPGCIMEQAHRDLCNKFGAERILEVVPYAGSNSEDLPCLDARSMPGEGRP